MYLSMAVMAVSTVTLVLWDDGGHSADPLGVTVADLRTLTQQMFAVDGNCVGYQLPLDLQGPGPLFVSVPDTALSGPTLRALAQLQDNYNPGVTGTQEKNAFLNAVMATNVMVLAETFLHNNNLLTGSLRGKLDEIWFTMYFRGGNVRSSGFKHVFMGELINGEVFGFHNWVSFQKEEAEERLNVVRRIYHHNLGRKGSIIKLSFNWQNNFKPSGSMYIGTSPELEMAAYTVCFLARPNSLCPVQMNNYQFQLQTHIHPYRRQNLVGSAYPII